jgi:hypothetical protein
MGSFLQAMTCKRPCRNLSGASGGQIDSLIDMVGAGWRAARFGHHIERDRYGWRTERVGFGSPSSHPCLCHLGRPHMPPRQQPRLALQRVCVVWHRIFTFTACPQTLCCDCVSLSINRGLSISLNCFLLLPEVFGEVKIRF